MNKKQSLTRIKGLLDLRICGLQMKTAKELCRNAGKKKLLAALQILLGQLKSVVMFSQDGIKVYGNLQYKIRKKQLKIENLSAKVKSVEEAIVIESSRNELDDLRRKEVVLWRQRSKCLWLKDGDRNTKFFHVMASNRKRNNMIMRIQDENDTWFDKEEDTANVFLNYFDSIFTTSSFTNMEKIFQTMDSRISEEIKTMLVREFKAEEIKTALDQMNLDKAPGPDEMTVCF